MVPAGQAPRPRVEEVAASAKVIRYVEASARLHARSQHRAADHRRHDAPVLQLLVHAPAREPSREPYRGASLPFVAQVLGQASGPRADQALLHHRDGPGRGSEAYRRAGGEPALYRSDPALFRIAI